jgi:AbrB family looped-hinge helix DNA binding protein
MQEIISTITSKGQVTIPAEVRRHLGVGEHGKITFVIDDDGEVRLSVPEYPTIESLRGVAGSLAKPLSWQQMKEIAHDDHVDEIVQSR